MRIGFGPIIRTPLRSCLRHCPSANALQPFVALRQRDVAVVALRRRVAAVAALLRCEVAECVSGAVIVAVIAFATTVDVDDSRIKTFACSDK